MPPHSCPMMSWMWPPSRPMMSGMVSHSPPTMPRIWSCLSGVRCSCGARWQMLLLHQGRWKDWEKVLVWNRKEKEATRHRCRRWAAGSKLQMKRVTTIRCDTRAGYSCSGRHSKQRTMGSIAMKFQSMKTFVVNFLQSTIPANLVREENQKVPWDFRSLWTPLIVQQLLHP